MTASAQNDLEKKTGRMDFVIETMRTDDSTRTAFFRIQPDPRRYDIIRHEGKEYYRDKYLKHIISVEEVDRLISHQMANVPSFCLQHHVDSLPEHIVARREAVTSELENGSVVPFEGKTQRQERFQDNVQPRDVVFLSVDVCNGSALRHSNPEDFEKAYKILFRELGIVVGQFNGAILKATGDGFIALIDFPAFTSQCDAAIDMGLSFLRVAKHSVVPALIDAGLPAIEIRVGADHGRAELRDLSVEATGFAEMEVASDALNRAVKIEQSCAPAEFRIGRKLYELIHVQWLERATEVQFDGTKVGTLGYQVYKVD